jgi:hypothetical protein
MVAYDDLAIYKTWKRKNTVFTDLQSTVSVVLRVSQYCSQYCFIAFKSYSMWIVMPSKACQLVYELCVRCFVTLSWRDTLLVAGSYFCCDHEPFVLDSWSSSPFEYLGSKYGIALSEKVLSRKQAQCVAEKA